MNQLPVVYLGVSLLCKWPCKQDWLKLSLSISNRLVAWKNHYLSMGRHITLINSVLSTLLTYWMLVFDLSKWVRGSINRVCHYFLWRRCDPTKPKCRLVVWTQVCESKNQGGWDILNLADFNHALFGQMVVEALLVYKFLLVWCHCVKLCFKYMNDFSFSCHPRTKSFFWKGLLNCRAALHSSVDVFVKGRNGTSF